MQVAPIHEIVQELRDGRMVILVDEEDRENEGDLVLAAEFVTPEAINFMARYARGLICLTLTEAHCTRLNLPLMVPSSGARFGTNFTVSIEAADGVTTGISAADRARTVQVAVNPEAVPTDIVQPGHIFPVMAQPGGVLARAGHTEAGCDLAALAGLTPASVICEVLKEDGTMARLPDLLVFAQEHDLKVGTIADLIQYRSAHESLLQAEFTRDVSTAWGDFRMHGYRDTTSGALHLALVHGAPGEADEALVRVHEPLSVLDLLEPDAGSHSWPVGKALERIREAPCGVMVMLNCDRPAPLPGQGDDAAAPAATTDRKIDLRTYGMGAQILRELGIRRMRLLSQPIHMPSMSGFDLEVTGFEV